MALRLPSFNRNSHEKACLVGVYRSKKDQERQRSSLEELTRLAETAGALVVEQDLVELRAIHPATYLGKGRVLLLAESVQRSDLQAVIFDEDLSPVQHRNLEEQFRTKVIDRTGLILDIFSRRARSREGKIQVELAQLKYLLPRLTGRGLEFSQLAGGIGTRGPGETKLEMDRRKARVRVSFLQRELKKIRSHRELHRKKRSAVPVATVAIVGYTNAGKSTLLNGLTHSGVLVEDKLFATLDPTVRRLRLPSGREILITDTVGFIRKLPHQLVDAFRATFEEVASADLLLHLIDISHPQAGDQIKTVESVLQELNLNLKPTLLVYNKSDRMPHADLSLRPTDLLISAVKGEGIPLLLRTLEEKLAVPFRPLTLLLPYQAGSELSLLYRTGRVMRREDRPEGIRLQVEVDEKNFNKFRKFAT